MKNNQHNSETSEPQSLESGQPEKAVEEMSGDTTMKDISPQEKPNMPSVKVPSTSKSSAINWREALFQHKRWLKSKGKTGERANLTNAQLEGFVFEEGDLPKVNLRGAALRRSNFSRSNLYEADLERADIREVNFQGAFLQGANFHQARMEGANLKGADLRHANLVSVTGLLPQQLTGTDLSGARLPMSMRKFEVLHQVEALTRNSRKLFLVLLVGCLYAWLALGSITDADLIRNDSTFPLPMFQVQVPIGGFFVGVSLLLFVLYHYFHLYLQRLWRIVAELPAVFPDGKDLDEKTAPWFLSNFIRGHFPRLREKYRPFSRLEVMVSVGLAWWMVPLTLFLFWGRYLSRHDWDLTAYQVVILAAGIGFGLATYRIGIATLRGKTWPPFSWGGLFKNVHTYTLSGVVLCLGVILFALSFGAINGAPQYFLLGPSPGIYTQSPGSIPQKVPPEARELLEKNSSPWNVLGKAVILAASGNTSWQPIIKTGRVGSPLTFKSGTFDVGVQKWGPIILASMGFVPFVDVRGVEVSTKPSGWKGTEEDLEGVAGANLMGRNLRFANMANAFLVNADLRGATLQGADLSGAQLQGARGNCLGRWCTNLQGARLDDANVWGANFSGANLREASLDRSNVQQADLRGTNLQAAQLAGTNLQHTNFAEANLKQADLQGAQSSQSNFHKSNLMQADLSRMVLRDGVMTKANLSKANLAEANLQGAMLNGANLQRANLVGADLYNADLSNTNLEGAVFKGSNLQKTNFRQAKNVTVTQIQEARNWPLAYYSDEKLLEDLELPTDHNENVDKRNLRKYDLSDKDLRGAHLKEFDFRRAKLKNTLLQGANLEEAKNLRQRQINQACVDEHTKLPPRLKRPAPCVLSD